MKQLPQNLGKLFSLFLLSLFTAPDAEAWKKNCRIKLGHEVFQDLPNFEKAAERIKAANERRERLAHQRTILESLSPFLTPKNSASTAPRGVSELELSNNFDSAAEKAAQHFAARIPKQQRYGQRPREMSPADRAATPKDQFDETVKKLLEDSNAESGVTSLKDDPSFLTSFEIYIRDLQTQHLMGRKDIGPIDNTNNAKGTPSSTGDNISDVIAFVETDLKGSYTDLEIQSLKGLAQTILNSNQSHLNNSHAESLFKDRLKMLDNHLSEKMAENQDGAQAFAALEKTITSTVEELNKVLPGNETFVEQLVLSRVYNYSPRAYGAYMAKRIMGEGNHNALGDDIAQEFRLYRDSDWNRSADNRIRAVVGALMGSPAVLGMGISTYNYMYLHEDEKEKIEEEQSLSEVSENGPPSQTVSDLSELLED